MPIKSFPKEIDGVNYEVTQFPADEAIVIMTKLLEIFGTSVGNIVEGSVPKNEAPKSILDIDLDFSAVGRAFSSLVMRLGEKHVADLFFRMLQGTHVRSDQGGSFANQNGRVLFNNHFAGRLSSLVKLLVFIVEVNYGDFFGGGDIGSLTDKVLGLTKSLAGSEDSTIN